jgi:hypothetical protein
MINADMRSYNFYIYGINNDYGQPSLSTNPIGSVKMAINITSQSTQDNINYHGATYMGLTHSLLDDSYVIQYDDKKLKVLYVNPKGRFNQVFMEEMA